MAPKGKGLGKGLGSLLGDVADINKPRETKTVIKERVEEVYKEQYVPLRMIEPNRDQPRKEFDEESLQELSDSIKQHGVIQPLLVMKKGSHYEIVAGERRWRAARMAGLKEVPVVVREFTEQEIAEISLIENIQRRDLNPIEEAMAYEKLLNEYEMTQEELSEHVSKSRTAITNSLRLLKLPEKVKEYVINGSISTGHAKVLLGVSDSELQVKYAEIVISEKLSVRDLEALIKKDAQKKPEKEKTAFSNQLSYETVENNLKERLGTRVSIKRKSENAGKIEISYFSLEDIERILAHIK